MKLNTYENVDHRFSSPAYYMAPARAREVMKWVRSNVPNNKFDHKRSDVLRDELMSFHFHREEDLSLFMLRWGDQLKYESENSTMVKLFQTLNTIQVNHYKVDYNTNTHTLNRNSKE